MKNSINDIPQIKKLQVEALPLWDWSTPDDLRKRNFKLKLCLWSTPDVYWDTAYTVDSGLLLVYHDQGPPHLSDSLFSWLLLRQRRVSLSTTIHNRRDLIEKATTKLQIIESKTLLVLLPLVVFHTTVVWQRQLTSSKTPWQWHFLTEPPTFKNRPIDAFLLLQKMSSSLTDPLLQQQQHGADSLESPPLLIDAVRVDECPSPPTSAGSFHNNNGSSSCAQRSRLVRVNKTSCDLNWYNVHGCISLTR